MHQAIQLHQQRYERGANWPAGDEKREEPRVPHYTQTAGLRRLATARRLIHHHATGFVEQGQQIDRAAGQNCRIEETHGSISSQEIDETSAQRPRKRGHQQSEDG